MSQPMLEVVLIRRIALPRIVKATLRPTVNQAERSKTIFAVFPAIIRHHNRLRVEPFKFPERETVFLMGVDQKSDAGATVHVIDDDASHAHSQNRTI